MLELKEKGKTLKQLGESSYVSIINRLLKKFLHAFDWNNIIICFEAKISNENQSHFPYSSGISFS